MNTTSTNFVTLNPETARY